MGLLPVLRCHRLAPQGPGAPEIPGTEPLHAGKVLAQGHGRGIPHPALDQTRDAPKEPTFRPMPTTEAASAIGLQDAVPSLQLLRAHGDERPQARERRRNTP